MTWMGMLYLLLAVLSHFIVGFIWYHNKVFGSLWMKGHGLDTQSHPKHGVRPFIYTFFLALISAWFYYYLAVHLAWDNDLMALLGLSLILSLGFIGTAYAINHIFSGRIRSCTWLIDVGYFEAVFLTYAFILYAMR